MLSDVCHQTSFNMRVLQITVLTSQYKMAVDTYMNTHMNKKNEKYEQYYR